MFKYSYQTMPKDTTIVEGMKMVKGDINNLRATIKQDFLYLTKDNKDLHLRILTKDSENSFIHYRWEMNRFFVFFYRKSI